MSKAYVIANFGGPRTLTEIEPFLRSLLTDKEVIRSSLPQPLHNLLFGRIAKKRARKITGDYEFIGGSSPIWADTEFVAQEVQNILQQPVFTFHRYLTQTHDAFFSLLNTTQAESIHIFPMFPQFTYATTGSIAKIFNERVNSKVLKKIFWVKSYPNHPAYIAAFSEVIAQFLNEKNLLPKDVYFIFSAHGLPKQFIDQGDLYAAECRITFDALLRHFPEAAGVLCYQSKFGPGEWIKPYTSEVCESISTYISTKKTCVFVPLSFTSDHIETLFEVEEQYLPIIRRQNMLALRAPALNRSLTWISSICHILSDSTPCSTSMLLR